MSATLTLPAGDRGHMRLAVAAVNTAALLGRAALRLVPLDQCAQQGHVPSTEPGLVKCARCGKRPAVTMSGSVSWR